MKKSLSLFILGLLISHFIIAQKSTYGIRAGLNLIPVSGTSLDYNNLLKPGLNAGGYFNYSLNKHFQLRTELYYSYKTTQYSRTDTASMLPIIQLVTGSSGEDMGGFADLFDWNVYQNTNAKVNMNYIELPVMLSYTPFDFLSISFGIYGSYLFSANSVITYKEEIPLLEATNILESSPEAYFILNRFFPAYEEPRISQTSSTSRFSSFDFGVISDISLKTEKDIIIGFRYLKGFWDFSKESLSTQNTHSAFQLVLAYPLSNLIIKLKTSDLKTNMDGNYTR
jgi:ribosome-associated toxin RatA of RatAB toxin-antitoxin module